MKKTRVLVAGCGSIGRRHIRNLVSLGVKDFVLSDPSEEALKKASEGLKSPVLTRDFEEALAHRVDAALICTPSSMHLSMSRRLAEKGVGLFIEKPLSHTLEGVREFASLVEEKGVIAMMAMCYRFHPVLTRVKELIDSGAIGKVYHVNYYGGHYLPDWHPGADYRKEYAARADLGGGVVLTSIHGLDTVRWIFGEVDEFHAFVDRVGTLEMDVEDLALGIFRMKSGAYVSWQTDFLQRKGQHRMVVAGELGTVRCDVMEGTVSLHRAGDNDWTTERIEYDVNAMYVEELRCFLDCVATGKRPALDMNEGVKTLRLALHIRTAGSRVVSEEDLCLTA